jgi:hypothetical protein
MAPKKDSSESLFELLLIQEPKHDDGGSSCDEVANKNRVLLWEESYDGMPALDSLTTETTAADDDSSVSTLGSTRSVSSRRSVFSKYWNATGQKPQSIQKRSDLSTSTPLTSQRRRSIIFSCQHGSSNSLPGTVQEEGPSRTSLERKAASMIDLGSVELSNSQHRSLTPLTSCLKRDRLYSGDRKGSSMTLFEQDHDDSVSIASSVRFDLDATAVRLYETPMEFHACQGWSGFFH